MRSPGWSRSGAAGSIRATGMGGYSGATSFWAVERGSVVLDAGMDDVTSDLPMAQHLCQMYGF